jgi:Cys-tRNA(Pro) deacylase
MAANLRKSAQRVQKALNSSGTQLEVVELPASTRTASEAASAIGTTVSEIAKSLVFKTTVTKQPVLIIASGPNRVNIEKVGEELGEKIEMADPEFVREQTGFVIGGVPPIGHNKPIHTLIDKKLLQYDEIWAAAGTPHAVFRLSPKDLIRLCGENLINVT